MSRMLQVNLGLQHYAFFTLHSEVEVNKKYANCAPGVMLKVSINSSAAVVFLT